MGRAGMDPPGHKPHFPAFVVPDVVLSEILPGIEIAPPYWGEARTNAAGEPQTTA
jgi:hypothetical protein